MNIAKIESLAKSIVPTLKSYVATQGYLIEDAIRKDVDERFEKVASDMAALKAVMEKFDLDLVDNKQVELISRKVFEEELEELEFEVPAEEFDRSEKFVAEYFESLRECLNG